MEFQSVSIMGGGGDAAVLEDAATNWYNSAGDVYMPNQVVLGGMAVYVPTTFTGTAFAPSPIGRLLPQYNFSGSGSASAHTFTMIPLLHYTYPINKTFATGISIVPAWGFKEDYGNSDTTITRYALTHIYSRSIDIEPSIAAKLGDKWSIGIGPDFNYFTVQSEAAVRTEGPTNILYLTRADSRQRFSGEQWKTGWHAGLMFRPSEATRVGLNYRSKIIMTLDGDSDFAVFGKSNYESNDFSIRVPLPAVTTLSAYHAFTSKFAMTGNIAYDQWSVNKAYHAKNVVTPVSSEEVTLTQNFKNTFDFSVGSHYKLTDQILLRGLLRYLQTPTNDAFRDISFPDGPKFGVHIGGRYQMSKRTALDLVYGHAWVWKEPINYSNPLTDTTLNGHVNSHVDFAGAELVINI